MGKIAVHRQNDALFDIDNMKLNIAWHGNIKIQAKYFMTIMFDDGDDRHDDDDDDDDDGECVRSGQRIERRSIPVRLNPPRSSTPHHHHSTDAPIIAVVMMIIELMMITIVLI